MIYEFAATQDLHGYDKPWAPGENYNLVDVDNPEWSAQYSTGLTTYKSSIVDGKLCGGGQQGKNPGGALTIEITPGEYTVSGILTGAKPFSYNVYAVTVQESGVWASNRQLVNRQGTNIVFNSRFSDIVTVPEGFDHLAILAYGETQYSCYFGDILVSAGSELLDYVPYANICMPEGFNIWDPIAEEFIQVYAGYVNSNTRELYLRPVYPEYAGEELVGPWMSSLDPYAEDTTPTEGAFVIDFGGELTTFEITPFMLQTLLDSLGIRQHFTDGAGLLNSLMDQAQGRVRSEEELLNRSRALKVIAIGDQLPAGLKIRPISKDVLPGLPGKFIR